MTNWIEESSSHSALLIAPLVATLSAFASRAFGTLTDRRFVISATSVAASGETQSQRASSEPKVTCSSSVTAPQPSPSKAIVISVVPLKLGLPISTVSASSSLQAQRAGI